MGKPTKRIVVTGGAGQIAYSLLFRIASGEMLGTDQPISLHILELPGALNALKGVQMELEDCAFPLLQEIRIGSDPMHVFEGAEIALLVGAKPRTVGMERKELLLENSKIFVAQGQALNAVAASNPLVLVVGNPCNTNCMIAIKNAPKCSPRRFFAMTCLDEHRARAQLALQAKVPVKEVKHMTIWGNHSSTQVPDFTHATIQGKPALEVIKERSWLEGEFCKKVQLRGAEVLAARNKSSAASAAHAVIQTVKALLQPTPKGEWFSCALLSDGNPYGIQEGIVFSFPCCSKGEGNIEIVPGLSWDPFIKERIALTEKELLEERSMV